MSLSLSRSLDDQSTLEAEELVREAGFTSVSAYVRHEFLVHIASATTPDTEWRRGGGRGLPVAHYVIPALYCLLWAGKHTQSTVLICARRDCGQLFEPGGHETQRYCKVGWMLFDMISWADRHCRLGIGANRAIAR